VVPLSHQPPIPAGWAITHGTGIVVAVIDTGVDMTNTDLAPKLNKRRQSSAE